MTDNATLNRVYGMATPTHTIVQPHGMRCNLLAYNMPRLRGVKPPWDATNRRLLRLRLLTNNGFHNATKGAQ
jgi:hypothetical protein